MPSAVISAILLKTQMKFKRMRLILICVFTDIGWSPYFCLIKWVVTELGGLKSHGAVVARKCEIPCVVNVANVTDSLMTQQEL